MTVSGETDWLNGQRRFPGELRLPNATTIIRVTTRSTLKDRCRFDTRYCIASATISAKDAAKAVRGHWQIENALHWTLDVTFNEDQSRLRKGHGANNMAIVRHFAINLVRMAKEPVPPQPVNLKPSRKNPAKPKATSLKLKRKVAGTLPISKPS